MKNLRLLGLLALSILLAVAALPANALSEGCARFPYSLSSRNSNVSRIDTAEFSAGDTLTWTYQGTPFDDYIIRVRRNNQSGQTLFARSSTNANGTRVFTYTFPEDGIYYVRTLVDEDGPGSRATITVVCAPGPQAPSDLGAFAVDGRINDRDSAAPIAVYPRRSGTSLEVLDTNGQQLLFVYAGQFALVGGSPATDTVVASGNGVTVIRQSNGNYAVTAPMPNGKTYVLIFDIIASPIEYTSYEIE